MTKKWLLNLLTRKLKSLALSARFFEVNSFLKSDEDKSLKFILGFNPLEDGDLIRCIGHRRHWDMMLSEYLGKTFRVKEGGIYFFSFFDVETEKFVSPKDGWSGLYFELVNEKEKSR